MTPAVILVAAGRGMRAGGEIPKQWQSLAGAPVARWTASAFVHVGPVVMVIHPDDRGLAEAAVKGLPVTLVHGAQTRAGSVRAGLEALEAQAPSHVLIQDVARCTTPPEVIDAVLAALQSSPGAAPALPVTDALWIGEDGKVAGTRDRNGLFRAQTPQGFDFKAILQAHRTVPNAVEAADDVAIARAAGLDVAIVPGDERNLKITTPGDFARAARLLKGDAMDIRLGNGFDVHAFEDGDHVVLCGVSVPHDRKLKGHSDADVGMHALTDAIYGALAEGDIGRHFPPSDPQWKGAESHIFLAHARDLAAEKGYALSNVDVTLICERPKVGPHAGAMMDALADILKIGRDRVSVKATTSERLGFTGREEGIAAIATATLVKP
ncbi:bifunctional 2-C-methyl-D-erythritol 4-phosphate cytidylyltransferase/2-C-methyl-D-erythritol 2,4-cyclodiphosphate synthase [Pacificoceanicola onchidii]|uniref:bifunctional 2-C-methyl-D-erythritol 4-phosphate cytidylyltransferase/2-C-methyl-D-erythritol 2,4-cyclodiphosphate synthase n=1 Tax=Pacificoceanicola onchidii TaxID=2562685 RepID=UPI0010A5F7F3|nr:bifunctional 2-C-methyl-D-erythritol 4-phosphate cytidylyltransferase/2-C-methyl-D-erythritol 2,4-cyclodiphosphate synthase [Pacificoceanicola onchidii]